MSRVLALGALAVTAACAGPSSTVPTGFETGCTYGPRIHGDAEMGVTDDGPFTDVDTKITMAGRVGGGCFGAALGQED